MSEDQPKPRTTIPKHLHVIVDSVLKDLKTVSKRITAFTSPFQEELRVLERLFYKNKNQHKSAVFWRKVPELRKYGKRVVDLNILNGVQSIRYRFYADNERTECVTDSLVLTVQQSDQVKPQGIAWSLDPITCTYFIEVCS